MVRKRGRVLVQQRQVQTQSVWTGGAWTGEAVAKGGEVWKEEDPEQETTENLFEDGDGLYTDAKEYYGWSLGV